MPITAKLANDKFRAQTRATWIADPADSSIQVDAIPANVPTYVILGWKTQYETLFSVVGTSGDNSSNYTLTGVVCVKGFGLTGNLPEGLAVNCLNNEEFFNQYSEAINDVLGLVTGDFVGTTDTQELSNKRIDKRIHSVTDAATVTHDWDDYDETHITAIAQAFTLANPTGTPKNADTVIYRIKDNGTARAITFGDKFRAIGTTLPTTTVISKTLYIGGKWNSADSKIDVIAVAQEA